MNRRAIGIALLSDTREGRHGAARAIRAHVPDQPSLRPTTKGMLIK